MVCLILTGSACGKKEEESSSSNPVSSSAPVSSDDETQPEGNLNPLTGLYNLADDAVGARPFAIMVNNVSAAQAVQKGQSGADVVYETMVEGGITRLLAVFSDPSKIEEIGSIRSARYVYTELAAGHGAVYVHAGGDPVYAIPHISEIGLDSFNIDDKYAYAGHRVNNGLDYEHRLFSSSEELLDALEKSGAEKTLGSAYAMPFMDFAASGESVTLSEKAPKVHVAFSKAYYSDYVYDETKKVYLKSQNGKPHIDYGAGTQLEIKNIFVLFTSVGMYPDNLHLEIGLESGNGYYCSEGMLEEISWEKGASEKRLTVKKADGGTLAVNPGNSWISIVPEAQKENFSFGE